ncbi:MULTISPECIES: response regulator [unclassified Tolypothrix]|uniref:response regulator n=1 Tax=unclassified Tolypothrix TaxID=2649714 RepID=UPI0005EAB6C2|nr:MULTISPECIES: response regulator [unclassified Tolypothrix]BAY91862.1 multi-component transcriptional regulator, winged helix family protein [Microchaete diplosiphon NIES-3275]EKF04975.1 response regulator [Tolypothrix sp. PCC 7601]MBE9081271.1 response regulator [Tolypothrix sp. LEGE 11397]UYD25870.1 response regulator [Tolypothrix sp. PCC 7712]UYD31892.1 response regulator [Tolypothrix sp. PCC 7601]
MKILLIEDDKQTNLVLAKALSTLNYQIETTNDGETGLELAKAFDYDLLILDVMLPKLDGISLCRQLRLEGSQVPILMLTAKDDISMRVMGLEAGADDYINKPFELSELIARIRALMRRGKTIVAKVLVWENLELDINIKEVTYAGKRLHLTPKEYGLLELFLQNPRRIFSRSVLLDRIWSADEFPGEEAVTTQIKGLRQKLKATGMTADFIETVYGLGYRLKEPKNQPQKQNLPSQNLSEKEQAEAKVMAVVANMREEFLKSFSEKFELLEQAIAQLSTVTPDKRILKQAQAEAHRLAGSLGCYGFLEGSKIARDIEQLLERYTVPYQRIALQLVELLKLLKQTLQQQPSSPVIPANAQITSSAHLLIVDDDTTLTERIKLEAISWGFNVDVAVDIKTARTILSLNSVEVILLDLSFPAKEENGLTFLAELSETHPEIPVLVLTTNNQLQNRVEAARLGAQSFLNKTMSAVEVLSAINIALNQQTATDAKVLVVDDDPLILKKVTTLLSPWGLQVTPLQESQRFWEVLESTKPDLLILDIEMPDFNGIELCQIIRNDHFWHRLPILFLSGHFEPEILYQVYLVGADDYIRKPIVEPELIARILNRLERTHLSKKLLHKYYQ